MERTVLSGTFSRSASSITTYWPLAYSKPRTVSARLMYSPWYGHHVRIWTRVRHVLWSRLKLSPAFDSVAR